MPAKAASNSEREMPAAFTLGQSDWMKLSNFASAWAIVVNNGVAMSNVAISLFSI